MKASNWTPEEDQVLIDWAGSNKSWKDIPLNRSYYAIIKRANILGVGINKKRSPQLKWQDWEIRLLKHCVRAGMSLPEIHEHVFPYRGIKGIERRKSAFKKEVIHYVQPGLAGCFFDMPKPIIVNKDHQCFGTSEGSIMGMTIYT